MKEILKRFLLILVWIYQKMISPLIPGSCRYIPTCSEYAKEAILKHGPFFGAYLAVKRLLSCHPWGNSGHDPVP